MSGGVSAACPPNAGQVQSVQARQANDSIKALGVMAQMATGQVSAADGMKQLQALVVDQAQAQGSLPPSSGDKPPSAPAPTGYSMKDTFDSGPAPKAPVNLAPKDASFLDEDSGKGAKPGVISGSN